MDGTSLLHRILNLKVKKVEILKELNARGIKCYPAQLSDALNGNYPYLTEKYHEILVNTNKILTEWETERNVKNNGIAGCNSGTY